MAVRGPVWAWHPHPLGWVLVAMGAVAYVVSARRLALDAWPRIPVVALREKLLFGTGLFLLFAALSWPLADLAQRSLLVRTAQQWLLLVAVPPCLLAGVPRWLADLLTRPAAADTILRWATRPIVATAVFNLAVVAAAVPAVVDVTATSPWARAGLDVGLLLAGLVMWVPVLRVLPGLHRLGRAGRAGYLILQSVIPSVVSLAFLLDRRPLYAAYRQASQAVGLRPLLDQQLAGAVAKVAVLLALLGGAAVILLRTHQAEEEGRDPDPLTWDDVARELRRLERRPPKDSPT